MRSTTKTRILIVRHAESIWNAEMRIQGQRNPPLTKLGLKQALKVAERVRYQSWERLYSSDLSRARQTADAIAGATGLEIVLDRMLREMYQGRREGYLSHISNRLYPDLDAPEVGREPVPRLRERSVEIFTKIRDQNIGKRVIIVTHGGLIRAFLGVILKRDDLEPLQNTACTLLEWDGLAWECELLGDISHLDEHER